MADGRVILQRYIVSPGYPVMFADAGEKLGLLDGVDAEVGFHIEVDVEHVLGIAGFGCHHIQYLGLHCVFADRSLGGRRFHGLGVGGRLGRGLLHGRGGGGRGRAASFIQHEFDAVADGRVIFQRYIVSAGNAVMLAYGGEKFGLLDGVYAEIGFHIEVYVEHILGIAGLGGHHIEYLDLHRVFADRGEGRRRFYGLCGGSRLGRGLQHRRGRNGRGRAASFIQHEFDAVADGRVIFQRYVVPAGNAVMLAYRGEELGLLDGVYAEVGFHIEVYVEHILGIAGLRGHHVEYLDFHRVFTDAGGMRRGFNGRRGGLKGRGLPGRGGLLHGRGRRGNCSAFFIHHELDAVPDGRVIFQRNIVFPRYAVMFAYGGEKLGLLDGVYAEVGFHVQVHVQHVLGIAGLGDHHVQYLGGHRVRAEPGGRGRFVGRRGFGFGVMKNGRGLPRRLRLVRSRSRRQRGFPGRGGVPAGQFFIFYPQRIVDDLQFRAVVAGDGLEPALVLALVVYPRLRVLPGALHEGHRHVRAEARREAYRVFEVVFSAL